MCNGRDALLRVRWPHAVFGRAGAHDGEAPSPRRFRSSGSSTLPLPISVAMAPSPSHRGKAPYGTRRRGAIRHTTAGRRRHDSARRRGAPLLRPLARLTSFGDMSPRHQCPGTKLPTTNYHLPTINYQPNAIVNRIPSHHLPSLW